MATAAALVVFGTVPACLEVAGRGVAVGGVVAVAVLGLALSAMLAVAAGRARWRVAAWALAAVVGSAVASTAGRAPVVYLLLATALLDSASTTRRSGDGPRPVAASAVLVAGAAWWIRAGSATALTIGLAGAVVLVLVLHVAPGHAAAVDRALDRMVRWLTRSATTAVVVVLSFPAVYLPALLAWPYRRWQQRRRRRAGTGWRVRRVAAADERSDARRAFAPEVASVRRTRNVVAVLAAVGLVALVVTHTAEDPPAPAVASRPTVPGAPAPVTAPPRTLPFVLADTPAFADVPWAAEIQEEHDHMQSPPVSDDFGIGDVSTRYTHIAHGVRRSQVSTCTCPEVKVWWLGGSAAFGWYERDEGTIPSELVRIAERDGIRLTIENRAVAGATMWQEFTMFSGLATFSPERPDMAIFFDGFNDVLAAAAIANRTGKDPTPMTPNVLPMTDLGPLRNPSLTFRNPGGPRAIGESAADKYTALAANAAALAKLHGMALAVVLQPDALASPRHLPEISLSFDVTDASAFEHSQLSQVFDAAERRIGDRVINLRNLFDDVDDTVFPDAVHLNETGARLTAEALYAKLRPRLHELAGAHR